MSLSEIVPEKVTDFTASNGLAVWRGPLDDAIRVATSAGNPIVAVGSYYADAVAEFFRHEEDERLGRWRSKVDPDIIGYPLGDTSIRLVNEAMHGTTSMFSRLDADGLGPLSRAAQEYFADHPEPKPAWHDAKPGDIWELKSAGAAKTAQYLVDDGRFFRLPLLAPVDPGWRPASFAAEFTAGRKVWPEDAS